MLLIGDVHAKYQAYERIIVGRRDTVRVGDTGSASAGSHRGLTP